MFSYSKLSQDVKITVTPCYDELISRPLENYYMWSCEVIFENMSNKKIKLLSICYTLIEDNGFVRKKDPAQIEDDSCIKKGHIYKYYCILETSSPGAMIAGGECIVMADDKITYLDLPIAVLDSPNSKLCYN